MTNKYMKRYSISLVIREMKIKTTIKYHFIHTRMAIIFLKNKKKKRITSTGENVEKLQPSYIASRNVKWYQSI